jgi:hypothetical protein
LLNPTTNATHTARRQPPPLARSLAGWLAGSRCPRPPRPRRRPRRSGGVWRRARCSARSPPHCDGIHMPAPRHINIHAHPLVALADQPPRPQSAPPARTHTHLETVATCGRTWQRPGGAAGCQRSAQAGQAGSGGSWVSSRGGVGSGAHLLRRARTSKKTRKSHAKAGAAAGRCPTVSGRAATAATPPRPPPPPTHQAVARGAAGQPAVQPEPERSAAADRERGALHAGVAALELRRLAASRPIVNHRHMVVNLGTMTVNRGALWWWWGWCCQAQQPHSSEAAQPQPASERAGRREQRHRRRGGRRRGLHAAGTPAINKIDYRPRTESSRT